MRGVMLGVALVVLFVVGAAGWIDEGEVVVLRTSDVDGEGFLETDLWIAEYRGDLYLRGASHRPWMERVRAHPQVELVRNGRRMAYRATPIANLQVVAGVDAAMAEKYGRTDWLAGMVVARAPEIAVRLDPVLVSEGSPE